MKTWDEEVATATALLRWLDEFAAHESAEGVQTELAALRIANPEIYAEAKQRRERERQQERAAALTAAGGA